MLACVAFCSPLHAEAGPAFSGEDNLSTDTGYALIEWTASDAVSLELSRQPDMANARVLYTGENTAFFISGLKDGTYFLALRDSAGEASAPLELSVAHQSLSRALWLAALGALVFVAVVGVIFAGARDE